MDLEIKTEDELAYFLRTSSESLDRMATEGGAAERKLRRLLRMVLSSLERAESAATTPSR